MLGGSSEKSLFKTYIWDIGRLWRGGERGLEGTRNNVMKTVIVGMGVE